jgi:drug/metabolite transporter (DMT)-like permease
VRAYFALAAVCFFWGTTYLGIRMALESFPPATLVCVRYLISGSIMIVGSLLMKARMPSRRELLYTSLFGVIIIGIGNGALAFAEQWVPSGLAALYITTAPFWLVGIAAAFGEDQLHGRVLAGMLVGFAGTLLLVRPAAFANGLHGPLLSGFLLLQFGSAGWNLGSILQRRHRTKAHPVVSGAFQQLATGLVFIVPALLLPHQPVRWSARGVGAVAYLVVFGSIVGYSAYIYTLEHLPISIVSLYNYINPIVAVLLGYIVYSEKLGISEIVGMVIIFAGVALVKRFSGSRQRTIVQAEEARETVAKGLR